MLQKFVLRGRREFDSVTLAGLRQRGGDRRPAPSFPRPLKTQRPNGRLARLRPLSGPPGISAQGGLLPSRSRRLTTAFTPTCDVRGRDLQRPLYVDSGRPVSVNSRGIVSVGGTRRLQGFGTVHSCALRRIFSARIRTTILRPHRPRRSRHRISTGWRGRSEVARGRYRSLLCREPDRGPLRVAERNSIVDSKWIA